MSRKHKWIAGGFTIGVLAASAPTVFATIDILNSWNTGDTLTALQLNDNFTEIFNAVQELEGRMDDAATDINLNTQALSDLEHVREGVGRWSAGPFNSLGLSNHSTVYGFLPLDGVYRLTIFRSSGTTAWGVFHLDVQNGACAFSTCSTPDRFCDDEMATQGMDLLCDPTLEEIRFATTDVGGPYYFDLRRLGGP